jgi:hypothetical protein
MITIYRRAEVIARCERPEVLAGLKSGRFEPTDHYESPETEGWISLTHFESRAYERTTPTDRPSKPNFICSYGDTIEPDATHRPIRDLKQLGELLRLTESPKQPHPAPPPPDPPPNPLVELLDLLTAPFRLLSQVGDRVFEIIGSLLAYAAIIILPIILLVATVGLCIFFPPTGFAILAIGQYLRKRG